MKKLSILQLFLFISIYIFAQEAQIFEKNEKFGIKNKENKVIVKPTYDYIQPIRNNFFLVKKDKKIGMITKSGKTIFPAMYDDIQDFANVFFLVMINNRWGVIDSFNNEVLPIEYTGFDKITDYLYEIKNEGKKGLLDYSGKIILPVNYDEISSIPGNLFMIKNGNKIGIVDDYGKIIIEPSFNQLEFLTDRNLYGVGIGSKLGLIDISGKVIAEPIFDEIDYSNPYYIILKKEGKIGFIINNTYIPANYDRILFTQEELGVIAVREGKLNGFVTIQGLVIPPIYDNLSRFSPGGQAFVEKRGKLMFVDITGKERSLQEVTGQIKY